MENAKIKCDISLNFQTLCENVNVARFARNAE